ncbi:MAG TPA: hypothetical protein VGS07_06185 [Thermoanaerobaculia bacterium]|nr:hypothetical protein [Thermoanaerobaculia bacterium]
MKSRTLGIFFLLSSLTTSVFAADRIIQNGIDAWRTMGDGSTFIDFAKNPIPAGFFCASSAPFTGKLAFEGVPVVTGTPGALGATDTIVQRLDDAVFNKRGTATTRLQFRALSLKSVSPIETSCGQFTATVRLDGVQPTTQMLITREDEEGGRFSAPLALNVRVKFTPVGRESREVLEITKEIRFPAIPNFPWQSKTATPTPAGFVRVDTDGDGVADTYLPGTSNFIAGHSSRPGKPGMGGMTKVGGTGGRTICHDSGTDEQHCFFLCNGCQIP